jgi:hypothetical protein
MRFLLGLREFSYLYYRSGALFLTAGPAGCSLMPLTSEGKWYDSVRGGTNTVCDVVEQAPSLPKRSIMVGDPLAPVDNHFETSS